MSRLRLRRRGGRLDRTARLLPGAEPAGNMRNRLEPHFLRGMRSQRRTKAASAKEHILLVLVERFLVVRACRVDPELQHAARAMEGARYPPFPFEFAHVTDIDQHH